jgi:UDP-2-acetamido-2,6-beta-L-arabino-hexul-4-ose reductase
VYIDDVCEKFIQLLHCPIVEENYFIEIFPAYHTTVGFLAETISGFKFARNTLTVGAVGTGLLRALYSTYISYLPPSQFSYSVPSYSDERGLFTEMLKTPEYGQISFFTAFPGVTRGRHYHHSKTEKFLVIKGLARFKFRHMYTHEEFDLVASGDLPTIVETIPGWTHDVTNIGDEEMVVMLWANEIFDRVNPDTYACPL